MGVENYLVGVDGLNGVGKGEILSRARILLEVFSYQNYLMCQEIPFRTATITEPPQLPLFGYVSHPASHDEQGKLLTWRQLLKEGKGKEILKVGAPDSQSEEVAFAEGFLTARALIEKYMFEQFHWSYNGSLDPYINMIDDISLDRIVPGASFTESNDGDWGNTSFSKMVIKDRGSASTAVFQGRDPYVRKVIEKVYREKDLIMEDLTFLVVPNDKDSWIKSLKARSNDIDIHDGKFDDQLSRYLNLRSEWENVFSKNIVYLFNDPSGESNDILEPVILLSILLLALKQNKELFWYDRDKQINPVNVNLFAAQSLLQRSVFYNLFQNITNILRGPEVKVEFEGLPIIVYSGDIGLVEYITNDPNRSRLYSIVLAKDLYKRVKVRTHG